VSETNKPGNSSEEDPGKANASIGQEPIMQRIVRFLEDARRELIDISRRNRLLHSPRSAERTAGGGGAGGTGGSGGGRTRTVRPHCLGFDAERLEGEVPDGQSRARVPLRFQTQLAPDALEKRLLRFFREARGIEEEQGVNILFLVFGSCFWYLAFSNGLKMRDPSRFHGRP
jgi:hypothetical protein